MADDTVIKAVISERLDGDDMPMLEAWVPETDPYRPVAFTDPIHAKMMGLDTKRIHTPNGWVSPEDGVDFVRNLWRAFHGNTYIACDFPTRGSLLAPGSYPRKSPRGEPNTDELEDIDGPYRRFQQRKNE